MTDDLFQFYEKIDLSEFEDEENAGWVMRRESIEWIRKAVRNSRYYRAIFRDFIDGIENFNKSHVLVSEIEKMIRNEGNLQIHIYGATMSGKSKAAEKISFLIRDSEKKLRHAHSEVFCEFTLKDCSDRLAELKEGDVLWRDEQNKASGEMSNILEEANENLRRSVRAKNVHFIDCQPEAVVSTTINFIIRMLGYNKKRKISLGLLYVCNEKISQLDKIETQCLGYVIFTLPNNPEFDQEYRKKKFAYLDKLLSSSGLESAAFGKDIIEETAEKLIFFAENHPEYKHLPRDKLNDWDLLYTLGDFPRFGGKIPKRIIRLAHARYQRQAKIESCSGESEHKHVNTQISDMKSKTFEDLSEYENKFYNIFIQTTISYITDIRDNPDSRYNRPEKHRINTDDFYIECFANYYCSPPKHVWSSVYAELGHDDIEQDSIRINCNRQIRNKLTKTDKGNILELALLKFFKSIFPQGRAFNRLLSPPRLPHVSLPSNSNSPDLLSFDGRLALNCKNYFNVKLSDLIECTPEYHFPDCWLALYTKKLGLVFFHNQEHAEYVKLDLSQIQTLDQFVHYYQDNYLSDQPTQDQEKKDQPKKKKNEKKVKEESME